jgi:hypothetical protein
MKLWMKRFSVLAVALALAFAMASSTSAQVNATAGSSAGTAFGTAISSAVTILPSAQGSISGGAIVKVDIDVVQTVLGVSCGAGTNTATPTIAWTGVGGTSKTLALSALSISANGALDTLQSDTTSLVVQMGSAVTFTMASALASGSCSPGPSYTVFWRVY